ncbi:MAG: DUF502 domain-containing protein [Chlamydiia bacterium]|nr:DUF502 domain-containing protein [Chlamydiia bacterium]
MKKYLITGLVILAPVALTLVIIVFLFNLFTAPLAHFFIHFFDLFAEKHFFTLPPGLIHLIARIVALLALGVFILLLGCIARWFLVKNFIAGTNLLLSRIPFIKTVYKVSKDIIAAIFSSDGKKAFKYPVMVPFPYPPSFSIGFQAGEVSDEIQQKLQEPMVSVFSPTAPHPISGFLLFIPATDVYKLDMTNEDALKFLVSCGIIHPDADLKEVDDAPF